MTRLKNSAMIAMLALVFLASVQSAFADDGKSGATRSAGSAATGTASLPRFAQAPPEPHTPIRPPRSGYLYEFAQPCTPVEPYQQPIVAPLQTQRDSPDLVKAMPPVQQHDEELVQAMPRLGED